MLWTRRVRCVRLRELARPPRSRWRSLVWAEEGILLQGGDGVLRSMVHPAWKSESE